MPMVDELSSREHLLAALNCKYPDNVHLASMIFGALEEWLVGEGRCGDQAVMIKSWKRYRG